ncbi:unnamed protein product, partial [Choristocarpus tenellus]
MDHFSFSASHEEVQHVVNIQRVVRGFAGRLAALKQVNEVIEKIYDPRTGGFYYYNSITGESSWKSPAMLKRILGEFGDLEHVANTYTDEQAAVMLQAAWRQRMAKKITRTLVASVILKVYDPSTGADYYYNTMTGDTFWSKPSLLGQE